MSPPSSPADAGETPWLRGRAAVVAAYGAVSVLLCALGGLAPGRLAALALGAAVLAGYALVGARRSARGPVAAAETVRQFWTAYVCNALMIGVTGGLESPLLPNLAGPAVGLVAFARSRRALAQVAASSLVVVTAWALAPEAWMDAELRRPHRMALYAFGLMMVIAHLGRTMLQLGTRLTATTRTLDSVRETVLEDVAERSRALEAVGAKVAHELRNPLAALKSLLQLERGLAVLDERSQRRFEVMTSEVARMESILRDYLSFSRPLENLTVGPVDLAGVADNVVAVLEGRARAAGVQVARTGPSVVLSADARRLKEALPNLAANALEATPRGGRVELAIERLGGGGRVSVRGTGVGMSAAVLEKLGTPFFTTRESGTGLGVVLARAVVQQHGGTLEFRSRPGDGTAAVVTIPFEVAPQGGPLAQGPGG